MFRSIGTIRYSPKSRGDSDSSWWVVLDCDPELGRYYRHLYLRTRYRQLKRPAWKDHVTIVRDEQPPPEKLHFWNRHAGREIEFECVPPAETDGLYMWLPVKCDLLLDIREELGIPRIPQFNFHLTFGNLKAG